MEALCKGLAMGIITNVISLLVLIPIISSCTHSHCHRKTEVAKVEAASQGGDLGAKASEAALDPKASVFVYKYDNSVQCQAGKGVSLEKMAVELKGIPILSQKKKPDGLMHIQVCGSATGMANVYEIPLVQLKAAEMLGFKKWSFE